MKCNPQNGRGSFLVVLLNVDDRLTFYGRVHRRGLGDGQVLGDEVSLDGLDLKEFKYWYWEREVEREKREEGVKITESLLMRWVNKQMKMGGRCIERDQESYRLCFMPTIPSHNDVGSMQIRVTMSRALVLELALENIISVIINNNDIKPLTLVSRDEWSNWTYHNSNDRHHLCRSKILSSLSYHPYWIKCSMMQQTLCCRCRCWWWWLLWRWWR